MTDVGETMGGMSQQQQQTADEVGPEERITPIFKILRETIKLREKSTIIKKRSLAGDNAIYGHATYGVYGTGKYGRPSGMIWGSTPYGEWGDALWGAIREGFKLGGAAGVLGTAKLGARDIEWSIARVLNPNGEYIETFRADTFEDEDNTTADWDTSGFKINFTDGQAVQSDIVAKNNEAYSTGKITLIGTNLTNLTLYLSANGGGDFEAVTNNVSHTFSNSETSGIKFKMVAGSDINSTFPLTFPTGFGCAVTDIKLGYN